MSFTAANLASHFPKLNLPEQCKEIIFSLEDQSVEHLVYQDEIRLALFQLAMVQNGLPQVKVSPKDEKPYSEEWSSFRSNMSEVLRIRHLALTGEAKLTVPKSHVREVLRLGEAGKLMTDLGMTVDYLRKVKEPIYFDFMEFDDRPFVLGFLSCHSPEMIVRLLSKHSKIITHGGDSLSVEWCDGYLKDTMKSYFWLKENNPSSLEDISRSVKRDVFKYHDFLTKEVIDKSPDFDLPSYKGLIGDEVLGYKVFYPTNTKDLKDIGRTMNHCVGSYGDYVLAGGCIIVQLSGENNYTIEIAEKDNKLVVVQNMGCGNSQGPEEITVEVNRLLEESLRTLNIN